ncbi:MAG: alpha-amylase family glycosyl hydrolase [Lachnospiraceae bacterium]
MWLDESVFYQIYPMGFCNASFENDGICKRNIAEFADWSEHLEKLGVNAVYFSPVFESDTHGYNTRDYKLIDKRLGTNEDFKILVDKLHSAGIKVVLDGVFNHVGRGFWAFQDVLVNRWNSRYKDWFNINFDGNSNYNDGLWYEGWEGCYDLVKLNLRNEEVVCYILDVVRYWVDTFDVDGLRLDVAYCLDMDFLRRLRNLANNIKPEFVLIGELLHGDYNRFVNEEMLHSCTNYECYKGLYSSFNSLNMFEIVHSLKRQFGPENWTLYKNKHLLAFVDNHDVTRVASILTNPEHLPLIYGLLFSMPGVPCIYYGSEWGTKALKSQGDPALRPCFEKPEWNQLTDAVSKFAHAHRMEKALQYGDFSAPVLTNKQCVLERKCDGERILIAINAEENGYEACFKTGAVTGKDILTGEEVSLDNGKLYLPPYSVQYIK